MEKKFASISTLSVLSVIFMCVMILFSVVTLFLNVGELKIYSMYSSDMPVEYMSDFEAMFILLTVIVGLGWIFFNILFIIFYLIWKYRVYKNLQIAKVKGLGHSPGWAVGWYFIPIAHLFKPYQVMKEIWQATFYSRGPEDWKTKSVSGILLTWWLIYIFSNLLSSQNIFSDHTISAYKKDAILSLLTEPLSIISGILLIIIIRKITKEQNESLPQMQEEAKDELPVENQI